MHTLDAATLIRRARSNAQLTQKQLARLAATSQSAIAAYESGTREPTLAVLDRIVRSAGHRIGVMVEPDPLVFRLYDLAHEIKRELNEPTRFRLVFEFLRGAGDEPERTPLLVAAEPEPTGDARFDALLAAIAEDLSVHQNITPPPWVHADERFLEGFWWVSDLPSARTRALVHTPASFRRRGVMLDRHDLHAA